MIDTQNPTNRPLKCVFAIGRIRRALGMLPTAPPARVADVVDKIAAELGTERQARQRLEHENAALRDLHNRAVYERDAAVDDLTEAQGVIGRSLRALRTAGAPRISAGYIPTAIQILWRALKVRIETEDILRKRLASMTSERDQLLKSVENIQARREEDQAAAREAVRVAKDWQKEADDLRAERSRLRLQHAILKGQNKKLMEALPGTYVIGADPGTPEGDNACAIVFKHTPDGAVWILDSFDGPDAEEKAKAYAAEHCPSGTVVDMTLVAGR